MTPRLLALCLLALLLTPGALGGCGPRSAGEAHAEVGRTVAPSVPKVAPRTSARFILVGDTGQPGPDIEAVRAAIKAEAKDAVLVAGDLVYPVAPSCPTRELSPDDRRLLDSRVGAILRDLGAPVLMALGNHDVAHQTRDPGREACLLTYAAGEPQLWLPALSYVVDFGIAIVAVVNSNALDDAQAAMVKQAFEGHAGWKLIMGHHVLRTYHDKEDEDRVRPWLARQGLRPDVWLNGHAHLLQLGVYGGLPAITSGTAASKRPRPSCPPACGEGQLFGSSEAGYALLELSADELVVTFKDGQGQTLHTYKQGR